MNPIFAGPDQGWPGYPRRSFARIEQTEPVNLDGNSEAVFGLDAVDASWPGFAQGGLVDLKNPDDMKHQPAAFWAARFKHQPPDGPDPYDEIPIYRIEVTLRPGDKWYKELAALGEQDWVTVVLDKNYLNGPEVEVYGGLLAAPVITRLVSVFTAVPEAGVLTDVFSMKKMPPDNSEAEISAVLASVRDLSYLIGLDVGQGSANGLADSNKRIQLYFDLGGGVYGNRATRPIDLRFCWMIDAPIVLSHWDADHWSGEASDPAAHTRTWIAPRQHVNTAHLAFMSKLLRSGGKLLVWGSSPAKITVSLGGGQTLDLVRCTGSTRNGSGIAAIVRDAASGGEWLLTGDAGYDEIPSLPASPLAIMVPHHGANMGGKSDAAVPRNPGGYVRLIYSFGPGNKHGRTLVQHPTASAMSAHAAWSHGTWVGATTPGTSVAGGDVLATAAHAATHLNGTVVGWTAAPAVRFGSFPHAVAGVATGCTGSVDQA